ncbi:MAG: sigma-54-dependent Fis family transcriptional regulator [bacterium]|nr:sigma-54-dependent Fis family transcriptional regulator [bacterium]
MDLRDGGSTAGFSTADQALAETAARARLQPVPALTILGHPDIDRVGDRVLLGELVSGREVLLSRHQPHFAAPGAFGGAALGDPFLSRSPIRFEPLPAGDVRLHRDRCGSSVLIDGAPLEDHRDILAGALDDGVLVELASRLVLLLHHASPERDESTERFRLVGDSDGIEQVRQAIRRVAELDIPVLLLGETGTGKELVARALHENSPRRPAPFIGVNLGALPPTLAAAELFGARKGAYTGADRDRPGYFGHAHGGTLFFDEIGEAPPEIQVMLLRALETREIVPVGGRSPRAVDVRIVSATDADLDGQIADGSFRAQLLHRLAGYSIHLPPLRRRREDLGRLLVHFLHRECERLGESVPATEANSRNPWLPAALVARLARYRWPGNARELRNVARQMVIDGRGRPALVLSPELEEKLPAPTAESRAEATSVSLEAPAAPPSRLKPSEVSEEELVAALRAQRWNLKATAEALGISRTSLYALLERSPSVRAAADVPPEEIRRAWERHDGELGSMVEELEISERALRQRLKDLGLR